jgi:hypothetical protein
MADRRQEAQLTQDLIAGQRRTRTGFCGKHLALPWTAVARHGTRRVLKQGAAAAARYQWGRGIAGQSRAKGPGQRDYRP